MKRYFKIFFLILPVLFLCSMNCKAPKKFFDSRSVSIISFSGHATPVSSMNENNPSKKEVVLLFRNGIEGKHIMDYCAAGMYSYYCNHQLADRASLNSAKMKYALSFCRFNVAEAEFLSSFSFRPPPANMLV